MSYQRGVANGNENDKRAAGKKAAAIMHEAGRSTIGQKKLKGEYPASSWWAQPLDYAGFSREAQKQSLRMTARPVYQRGDLRADVEF